MTTATFPISTLAQGARPQRKGFFARLYDRMVESRTRQAERLVRHYLDQLAPELAEIESHKEAVGKTWSLPFVR